MNNITPLFQLNLLLHMCMPYHKSSGFNPYFYNKGFSIRHIETAIPLPQANINHLSTINVTRKKVSPEIVLANDSEIILFECKISDFELDFSHHSASQAAGYLSLNPTYLRDYFGLKKSLFKEGKIMYGILPEKELQVKNTLQSIQKIIENVFKNALPHEVFTIIQSKKGIYIKLSESNNKKPIKIIDSTIMENEQLFYIIPTDISGNIDENSENILKLQIKQTLRSVIGRGINFNNFSFSTLDICKRINPIWDLLPNFYRTKLKLWINDILREFINDFSKIGIKITYEKQTFKFPTLSEKQKDSIRKYLISEEFLNIDDFPEVSSIQLSLNI